MSLCKGPQIGYSSCRSRRPCKQPCHLAHVIWQAWWCWDKLWWKKSWHVLLEDWEQDGLDFRHVDRRMGVARSVQARLLHVAAYQGASTTGDPLKPSETINTRTRCHEARFASPTTQNSSVQSLPQLMQILNVQLINNIESPAWHHFEKNWYLKKK